MPIEGEYEPSTTEWVRNQVEEYVASGGTRANTMGDSGLPIVLVIMKGAKSGMVRKVPLMKVEHDGEYALVASVGGAPKHPAWYHNLLADPNVMIQDGPRPWDATVDLASGEEREIWWQRAVSAFPRYAEYGEKTAREIPIFIARPVAPARGILVGVDGSAGSRHALQWA
ncbi:MAG: nitroreductase family deazaflavin-dependent oxidoreductase, partial [Acidimicrobiales bacterium]